MKPIYEVERNLEVVKQRLKNSGLPNNVKDKIFEFVSTLREGSGIKEHRQYYYFERLIILADILQDRLLNPSKKDAIECIATLRDKTTNRHTHYSPATISDFKKVLKKFVKWANEGELAKFWDDIHAEKVGSRYSKPEQMITYEDLQKLIESSKNARDKALISLLWDSGVRASELLKLKVRDFQKSKDGLYATLNISEGSKNYKQRTVVLVGDSVVLVTQWIERLQHEKDYNEDMFLFQGIGKENTGETLSYDDLRALIKKITKRAGITKPIAPHLFRHSAATRFAVEMPTQVFVKQMGWASNKMADNYTHLDKSGQITAILKSHNIEITDEELNKPVSKVTRRCPRCHVVNTGGARFCSNCGSPIKPEDFIKVEAERQKVMDTLKTTNMISPEMQNAMDVLPEDAKLDLLATLLLKMEKEGKLEDLKNRVKK